MTTDILSEGHRSVFVPYVLPAFKQLNGVLFNGASDLWDGYEWQKLPFCSESETPPIDTTPRELVFFMKHFGKEITSYEVIAWAAAYGFRAANHLETLAYAQAFPGDQLQVSYIGLGSFAVFDSRRFVAYLSGGCGNRLLRGEPLVGRWPAKCRFLLVRK